MKTNYSPFAIILDVDLTLFAGGPDGGAEGSYGVNLNTNVTTQESLSAENKTFWDTALLRLAEPELVHGQFAQKRNIPANNGKTIEFRQFDSLPPQLTPLTEGVTPDGQSLSVKSLTATVLQYGGYVTVSDILSMTGIDPVVSEATRMIARQAGETIDTIDRDIFNAGTNVLFAKTTAGGTISARASLYYTSKSDNCNLTVDDIKRAVRALKRQNAPKINGDYVAIIHPDVAYDLMRDPEWLDPKKYVDTDGIYRGEIGKLYGVRFIENTRAKTFGAEDLASDSRTLAVNGAVTASTTVGFDGGTVAAGALVGRLIRIGDTIVEVTANTTSSMTVKSAVTAADNAVIYPGEGGIGGAPVYSTLVFAADAVGTTEIAGGGIQHIVKPRGSGGTSDPLNQRATVGWSAVHTAKILIPQYLLRIESTATP